MSYAYISLEELIEKPEYTANPNNVADKRIKEIDTTLTALENEKKDLIERKVNVDS